MLRKIFTALCLCGFVVSLSACSAGHGDTVKKGDPEAKKKHQEASKDKEDGNVGTANDI